MPCACSSKGGDHAVDSCRDKGRTPLNFGIDSRGHCVLLTIMKQLDMSTKANVGGSSSGS